MTKSSLLSLLLLFALSARPAQAEKYKRAMIFAGGQLATAVHIGMLDAALDQGWNPDLIIASCGGAMAAAMVAIHPDRQDRLEYLFGREFHELYNGLISFNSMGEAIQVLAEMRSFKTYPNIFDHFVLKVPFYSGTFLDWTPIDQKISSGAPSVLIVAGKVLKGREIIDQKKLGPDLFQEVYLTDAETAQTIRDLGVESPFATSQPGQSYIRREVSAETNMSLYPGIRASGADPFLTQLPIYNGQMYITGAINIQPVELASQLADEVIMRYPLDMPDREYDYLKGIFGFDPRQRAREVAGKGLVNLWVDFTDWDDQYQSMGFFPHFSFMKLITFEGMSDDGIPDRLEPFQKKLQAQYQYGYQRMQEAFRTQNSSANPTGHIRNLTPGNSRLRLFQRDLAAVEELNARIRIANRPEYNPRALKPYKGMKESPLPRWEDYKYK